MCKCIEDCLASKAGFRLFLTVVVVIVTVAVGVNVAFLLKSMEINEGGAEEQPKTPVIERLKELHSVVVLTEDPGYPQELLSRINYLRHNQCPDIKDCTFTSATSPGDQMATQLADAVVVVGGGGTFQNYTLEGGLKTRHGDRIASKSRPITAQLMSSPKDFRDTQALGRRHIRSGH